MGTPIFYRRRSILCGILGVILLLSMDSIITPDRVQAQPRCVGARCTGQDPQVMGCGADAVTLQSSIITRNTWRGSVTDGLLEFRYSRACQAIWARTTNWGSRSGPLLLGAMAQNASYSAQGNAVSNSVQVWSKMMAAPRYSYNLRACGLIDRGLNRWTCITRDIR